ncbi:MAG: ATP-binding protein [Edaphobacter sp.]|uniref:sensor histidine kinase n=1 Tax=Edaphobacter sp. TaxID=1934404 RepID=UPI0023A68F43|nr:ATP-binding protein [Edaphobacter sp.]MDE1177141.1 ATP-binding protein [Edaphobacter sp.]
MAFAGLAAIVLVYKRWLHVNTTTVALTLLLFILLLATEWGLRFAVVISVAAAACYNFFFLPPFGTFTISDTENWLALLVFLATSIIASRLSQAARDEADEASARQHELEVLFQLSRDLLQTESAASLLRSLPAAVVDVTAARYGLLYLLEGGRVFQAGDGMVSEVELPHFQQIAISLTQASMTADEVQMPVRSGVRPKGMLLLRGVVLSLETANAIGGLVSIAIDRAQALENVARGEAAKENERLRSLMIDSITHELRTPLTSIKGAATTLLESEVNAEDRHELLSIIDEESDRLNRLVSEAVETAQLDAQKVQMHFERVTVRGLIDEARDTCGWVEENHELRLQIAEDLWLRADPSLLVKVITNLLENAAKYSPSGTPITVTAEAQGAGIAISVADRGIGIDPTEQGLIFERFYRGRLQASGASGTGMGLAISRAIVEAHGGRIIVTSQLEHGSVFTVLLPGGEASPQVASRIR